jgi:valyl-tRNA synthetase
MAEISKSYEPRDVEKKWYAAWLGANAFAGRVDPKREAFSVVIPPPNVTGVLTMGHVLNNTLQDILTRRARLEGKSALWLPGTDHAGIATQTVVERELRKEKKTRHDFGREKFLDKVWEWRNEKGGIILEQLRRLGASCDWERTQFTMDPHYSRAVLTVFVDLFAKGHIYRGKRMVNWCPVSQTALSDEEVIMKPVNGTMYRVRYERVDAPGQFIEVKTTRPETIPGDVAIAVHPDDSRYAGWIGKKVRRAIGPAADIPIIADAAVDKEFGTGALKITPAHDKADFEIGARHNLPIIDVLESNGRLNELAGPELAGQERFAGRKKAAEMLKERGALVAEEAYANNVGYSERADVPIEPRLTWQWWLRYPRVEEAKAAVRDGHITFHPERWSKVYLHWLENIQDWCISRQLWWGHRIPVWYRKGLDRETLTEADLRDVTKVHVSLDGPADHENWVQEDDVLDTWASSWLWPFVTMGWPDAEAQKKAGLDYFYPTTTLVTGPDIIFFWVARMIMAGLEYMGGAKSRGVDQGRGVEEPVRKPETGNRRPETADLGVTKAENADSKPHMGERILGTQAPGTPEVSGFRSPVSGLAAGSSTPRLSADEIRARVPFRNVYFTGIIRDAQGRKMSKSLGNSPDPLDLIAKYGADGLRFGIVSIAPQGQDIRFQEDRIESGKNFCNKLWNACRFRQMSGEAGDNSSIAKIFARLDAAKFDADDHAILERLIATSADVERCFSEFEFSAAVQALYGFFWNDFCDWYVEVSKSKLQDPATKGTCLAIQDLVLRQTLLLLHPFIPFITEELWHQLGYGLDGKFMEQVRLERAADIVEEARTRGLTVDRAASASVEKLKAVVSQARALKAEHNLASRRDVKLFVIAADAEWSLIAANLAKLARMAGAAEITRREKVEGAPAVVTPLGTVYLDLASMVDVGAEKTRLARELDQIAKHIAGTEARLANQAFVSKAPPAVLDGARKQLAEQHAKRAELERLVKALG